MDPCKQLILHLLKPFISINKKKKMKKRINSDEDENSDNKIIKKIDKDNNEKIKSIFNNSEWTKNIESKYNKFKKDFIKINRNVSYLKHSKIAYSSDIANIFRATSEQLIGHKTKNDAYYKQIALGQLQNVIRHIILVSGY